MKNTIIILFVLLGLQFSSSIYAHAPSSSRVNVSGSIVLENNEMDSRISDEMKSDPDAGAFHKKKKKFGLFNKLKQKLVRLSLNIIQNEGRDDRPYHWSAITALVCGGLTLFTGLLFLPAIIFGAIGILKTGPKKEYKGLGMAIGGLGLGLLIGAIFILYIIYIATVF
jgi:hypothetical protein